MMKGLVIASDFLRTSTEEAARLTCLCKQRFETEADAHFAIKRARHQHMHVYQCSCCQKFHLTSSNTKVPEHKRRS
jgi:hypothetical protein